MTGYILPSPRQYQILQELLKDGADNRTIARRLQLSEDTVKTHMKELFRKAEVNTRTELVVAILQGHLLVKNPPGGL